MIEAGTILYADSDCPEGIEDARAYCRGYGLTGDDVRLARKDGTCVVIAKRDLRLTSKGSA